MKPWEKYQTQETTSGPWEKYGGQETQPSVATPDQYLSMAERLKIGFAKDPQSLLEEKRAERGLAPGTPLEPTPGTASFMENLKDLPGDVVDIIGPAIPFISQAIGSAAFGAASIPTTGGMAAPLALVKGGAIGAAAGEFVKQVAGEYLFGLDQGTLTERSGKVMLQGVLGAAGEGVAQGINLGIRTTKMGLLKSANNLLKTGNVDKITTGLARIFKSSSTPDFGLKIQFALDSLRGKVTGAIDKTVISKTFSDPKYLTNFTKELLAGNSDDFVKTMYMRGRPVSQRAAFRDFYKHFFNVEDDVFNTVMTQGPKSVKNMTNFAAIKNTAGKIQRQLPNMYKKLGKELGMAREKIASRADNVPGVTDSVNKLVSDNNFALAEKLADSQLLIREGSGLYSFNSDFVRTSTGNKQLNIFKNFITDFFEPTDDVTRTAFGKMKNITIDSPEALMKLVSGKRKAMFSPLKKTTFKQFSKDLRKLDIQISGKEFDAVGDLSSQLAGYVKGLRNVTANVGDVMGDSKVSSLARSYGQLAEISSDFRGADKVAIEKILTKFNGGVKGSAEEAQNKALNSWVKHNFGYDVNRSLNLFKSNQKMTELARTFNDLPGINKIHSIMENAFSKTNQSVIQSLEGSVDRFLPDNLKIALNAKRHTVAEMVNNDAISLLRAGFLGRALPVQQLAAPTIGAISGGMFGGKEGAMLGFGTGFALQHPSVMRGLLKASALHGGKQVAPTAAKQLPKATGQVISELLRQIKM